MSLTHPQTHSFVSVAIPIGVKVLFSILCGGLIGLEREIKNKPAGIKTNILICLGSALYTIISVYIAQGFSDTGFYGDPARIAAQIVPGIGFIGAGAIMQSKATIHGLTTAATIWVVAAIGMCIGAGYTVAGLVFTLTVLFTLLAINKLEAKFIGRTGLHVLEIVFEDDKGEVRANINQAISNNEISLDDFDISRTEQYFVLRVQYTNNQSEHKDLIKDLWTIKGIREVKQI